MTVSYDEMLKNAKLSSFGPVLVNGVVAVPNDYVPTDYERFVLGLDDFELDLDVLGVDLED